MSTSESNEFTVSLTVQFDTSFSQEVKDELRKEMIEKIRLAQAGMHKFMIEDEVIVRTVTRFAVEPNESLDSASSVQEASAIS